MRFRHYAGGYYGGPLNFILLAVLKVLVLYALLHGT
jgi:hypothetical protein